MRRSTSTIAALLCAFLTLFCVVPEAVAGHRLMRGHSTSTPPPPAPPAVQTAYWGPKTLNGNGGYDPCQGLCTLPITSAPDTANFYWDTTNLWVIPKNGATKTYNGVRTTPLSGTEDFVLTDSGGHTITVHNTANATIAGNYTVRWRDGDTINSVTGTNQIFAAKKVSTQGDEIVFRGGTSWNTTANTAPGFNGTANINFPCNTGTCLTTTTDFTGSNWTVVRPELGTTVTIAAINLQGNGWLGSKWTGFRVTGLDYSVCYAGSTFGCTLLFGAGSDKVWFDSNTLIGNTNDPWGQARPEGIIATGTGGHGWKLTNNNISYVANGVVLSSNGTGTYPADLNGTAPATFVMVADGNTITNAARDVFKVDCPSYMTFTNNTLTDKADAILPGTASTSPAWINPFDTGSGRQRHSDFTQFDCNGGVYQFYPGNVIENNFIGRGIGIDSLPFWTAPPFPSPNTMSGQSIPAGATIPDPTLGVPSGQGIYFSNVCGTITPGCSHNFAGTSTPRPYNLVMTGASIKNNVVMMEFANGFLTEDYQSSVITGNVVLSPHPPPANLYDTSANWNLGVGSFFIVADGASTVERNISSGTPSYGGFSTSLNLNTPVNTYPTYFQNPTLYGSPRSWAEYRQAFRPIKGGLLEVDHVNHIYAGPVCWDGSTPSSTGVCPP